jgi:hypothetical protein
MDSVAAVFLTLSSVGLSVYIAQIALVGVLRVAHKDSGRRSRQ